MLRTIWNVSKQKQAKKGMLYSMCCLASLDPMVADQLNIMAWMSCSNCFDLLDTIHKIGPMYPVYWYSRLSAMVGCNPYK